MALTPQDVEEKTFGTALRGYDLDEVDDFLDEVVSTIKELQDQLAEAKAAKPEPVEAPEPVVTPEPTVVDESAVGRALIAAQAAADQLTADAEGEAEKITEEAKEEAERLLTEAREEANSWAEERDAKKADAEAEMTELAGHVSNVRQQLALLATAVADRLDEMDEAIAGQDSDSDTDTSVEVDDLADTETFDLDEVTEADDADEAPEDDEAPDADDDSGDDDGYGDDSDDEDESGSDKSTETSV